MKKADPISILIICAVIVATAYGTLSLRQSLIRDRQAQKGTFYVPPREFSYAAHAYPGAATLPELAHDMCAPDTWAHTLLPDIQIFAHVMRGGNPADIGGMIDPPEMEYCHVFRTQHVDCDTLLKAIPAVTPNANTSKQAMQDALQAMDVRECGLIAATVSMSMQNESKALHYLAAGRVHERWRVLMPLDM